MPRNDDLKAGQTRVQIQLGEIVNDANTNLADGKRLGLTQARGPSAAVVVATHRGNRSDFSKLMNYVCVTDVAGVNDEVTATKSIDSLGSELPVGVGDQSDAKSTACSKHPVYCLVPAGALKSTSSALAVPFRRPG